MISKKFDDKNNGKNKFFVRHLLFLKKFCFDIKISCKNILCYSLYKGIQL